MTANTPALARARRGGCSRQSGRTWSTARYRPRRHLADGDVAVRL
ncbi:MAG: hypothetical protein RJR34_13155 [Candidatus Methanoculleus thermohydrogenotrophicum]|nr:hypothetical protein [Candidatus Methanoculleus thermohydrogenotrophicum]